VPSFGFREASKDCGGSFSRLRRLEAAGLCRSQPVVNSLMRESTHVVFSLRAGCETTPAGELGTRSIFEIDLTFPRPCPCCGVLINDATKELFTVKFIYLVLRLFYASRFHNGDSILSGLPKQALLDSLRMTTNFYSSSLDYRKESLSHRSYDYPFLLLNFAFSIFILCGSPLARKPRLL
jgi:hypothetical protein